MKLRRISTQDGSVVRRVVPKPNYTYVFSCLKSSLKNHHWIGPNIEPKELLLATEVILKKANTERPPVSHIFKKHPDANKECYSTYI